MKREILINGEPRETRVAILEDDKLVELLVDRPDLKRTVGNIYKGRVEAVLPGMQAAFVEIGGEKSAFLHVSDLIEPDDEDEDDDNNGNGNGGGKTRFRRYPNIGDQLKRAQTLLVQVTKEPISTKGPRVSAQISIPGRYLVYMPFASKVGISRKIESREERTRLRTLVKKYLPDGSGGVIVRTVSEDLSEAQIKRELRTLVANWRKMKRKANLARAPSLIRREASLTGGIIRDLLSDKVDGLYVDSKQLLNEIKQYLKQVDPDLFELVTHYQGQQALFDKFGIEDEIRDLFKRRVDLPNGGYLVIEPTEALVSIDVNTGRYVGKHDHEKTILKTNMEAAKEIARQLRLRDVGGIIVIDFIDMENRSNRDRVLQHVRSHLGRDRARTRAFQISPLGLIEMTRQRVRPSLWHSMTRECHTCRGTGRVFSPDVVVRQLERTLLRVGTASKERRMILRVHPDVALYVLEQEPGFLKEIGKKTGIDLEIRDDPTMVEDDYRLISEPAGRDVTDRYAVA